MTVGSKPRSTRKASGKSAAPKGNEEGDQETERAETGTES
jgi:hypothetical protein